MFYITRIKLTLNLLALATVLLTEQVYASAPAYCDNRANDTVTKLSECISGDTLMQHLQDFQNIANASPTGNRDSGDPGMGYEASLQYVKNQMDAAGYQTTVQTYSFPYWKLVGTPVMQQLSPINQNFILDTDFNVYYYSTSANITAPVQPVLNIIIPPTSTPSSTSGCSASDFAGFVPGRIALIQRGGCTFGQKVKNATTAGASGVIIFNEGNPGRIALDSAGTLGAPIPGSGPAVAVSFAIGQQLYNQYYQSPSSPPVVNINISAINKTVTSENLIANSVGGNKNNVVIFGAHLDSLNGPGILDNASGSAAVLEIALQLKKINPLNQMRFIWWGAEEEGIYGSQYYINNLSSADLNKIGFYLDADVIATPNWYINVTDANTYLTNYLDKILSASWQKNAIKQSSLGTNLFINYLQSVGLNYVTDDRHDLTQSDTTNFLNAGIASAAIFTGQGDQKSASDVALFGGFVGLTENCADTIPPAGAMVNCDDMSNINPYIFEQITKAYGAVFLEMIYNNQINSNSSGTVIKPKYPIYQEFGHKLYLMQ